MFTPKASFSSFSVDDVAQAKEFYGQTLGLAVADGQMGTLEITDEKGVARGMGPDIAGFKDPAGNVLAVISGEA